MILTLTVECVSGRSLEDECIRVIEIDENACLYDLSRAVLNAVGFEQDHLFEFYIANSASPWAHKRWLSEKEEWKEREDDFFQITLSSIYPLGRKRLYYIFDWGDMWTFEVRKKRGAKKPETDASYPRVVQAIGSNPQQYPGYE
ncbi:hypothetical protein ACFL2Q_03205 [Thermodesulfobacteriota bacterium]